MGDGRDAGAGAEGEAPPLVLEAEFADALHQLPAHRVGLLGLTVEQDQTEFVAPQPAQIGVIGQGGFHGLRNVHQQGVAHRMAAGIVHQLELVEVDVAERMLFRLLARRAQGTGQPAFHRAAVGQRGQGVVERHLAQAVEQLFLFGLVAQHVHRADPAAAGQRCAAVADGKVLPEPGMQLGRSGLAVRQGCRRQEAGRRILVAQLIDLHQGFERARHCLVQGYAEQALGSRIEVRHLIAGVGDDDGVVDRLQRDMPAFLLFAECSLVELALGDVEADRQIFHRHAGVILDRDDGRGCPEQPAVPGAVADFAAPGPPARNGFPQVAEERSVVPARVDDAVVLADQFFARVAAHDAEQVVDEGDVAGEVGFRHVGRAVERLLLFVEIGEQLLQGGTHVIERARGFLQFRRAARADGNACAVVAGLDLARCRTQTGQILQIDSEQHVGQPAEQGERGGEQGEQAGAEVPEKIFIRMGRWLDHQAAIGGAANDQGFLHDRHLKAGQLGKPVRAVSLVQWRLLSQEVAIRRDVFRVAQVALGDWCFQMFLQGIVVAQDGRVGHRLRQRGKLCRSLNAQGFVGVVTRNLQRLLTRKDKHDNEDGQERAHDAPLRAEQGQVQALH